MAVSAAGARPAVVALTLAGLAAATLAGARLFEWAGYTPCELCLLERQPLYGAVPLALATAWIAAGGHPRLAWGGFAALAGLFALGAGLGLYHAGVEWQFWPGPSGCSGAMTAPAEVGDFLKQLNTVKVVRCDAAALRILGLSLAGWNAVASSLFAALAVFGLRRLQAGSSATGSPACTVPPSSTLA